MTTKNQFDNPVHFYNMMKTAMATASAAKVGIDALRASHSKHGKEMVGHKLPGASRSKLRTDASRSSRTLVSTAPAAVSGSLRGARWDFGRAPDVGLGPGLRLSGHTYVCEVWTQANATAARWAPFGSSPSSYIGPVVGTGASTILLDPSLQAAPDVDATSLPIFIANGALRSLVRCFERFHFSAVTLEYTPAESSSQTGAMAIGYENDAWRCYATGYSNNTATSFQVPLNLPTSASTSFWSPMVWKARVAPAKSEADLFFVDTQSTVGTAGGNDGGTVGAAFSAQERMTCQGGFIGYNSISTAATAVHGHLTVRFVLDLYATNFFTAGVQATSPGFSLSSFGLGIYRRRRDVQESKELVREATRALTSLVREEVKQVVPEKQGGRPPSTTAQYDDSPLRLKGSEPGWVELRSTRQGLSLQ
jgi:hypothetical protein